MDAWWKAVVENDVTTVIALLRQNRTIVNRAESQGYTPLHVAAGYGHKSMCAVLVAHGALVNALKPDSGQTALLFAVLNHHTSVVSQLMEAGADPNIKDKDGATCLHIAAQNGNQELCEILVAHGAQANAVMSASYNFKTPLEIACLGGHGTIVSLLVSAGANQDSIAIGHTPLHSACQTGDLDSVLALCNAGANLRIADESGDSPLHTAAYCNSTPAALALLDRGCDVNIKNTKTGKSPLMYAAYQGNVETVSALLQHGADPNMINETGNTALSWAIYSENLEFGSHHFATIELLAPVTSAYLAPTLEWLARSQVQLSPVLKSFIRRCTRQKEVIEVALRAASKYGNAGMLNEMIRNYNCSPDILHSILNNSVQSDSATTCEAIMSLYNLHGQSVPQDLIQLACKRGNMRIRQLLDPEYNEAAETEKRIKEKLKLTSLIMNKTAEIMYLIPRSEEYPYNDNIERIKLLLKHLNSNGVLSYEMLESLDVAKVHYNPTEACPAECLQKSACNRIRETVELVELIVAKLKKIEISRSPEGVLTYP